MTDDRHVSRPDMLEKIARLNELERVIPIYLQALQKIADTEGSGPWGRIAETALREALRR